jgi:hypothetical protein
VLPTAAADRREEKTGLYNLTSTLRYMCWRSKIIEKKKRKPSARVTDRLVSIFNCVPGE